MLIWLRCGCTPKLNEVIILKRHKDQLVKELNEVYYIRKQSGSCISEPSVTLHDCEYEFLDQYM